MHRRSTSAAVSNLLRSQYVNILRCTFNMHRSSKYQYKFLGLPDPCLSDPCENGGSCFALDFNFGFVCECPENFKGETCHITKPSGELSNNWKVIQ